MRAVLLGSLSLLLVACAATPARRGPLEHAHSAQKSLNDELLAAVLRADVREAATMLGRGASPNARDQARRTALMLAVTLGHAITEQVIQEGLGARVEILGLPAPPVTQAQLDTIELLLRRGADVEAAEREDKTALMMAVERDYASIVRRLIAAGADLDVNYASGLPLMCLAANRGFTDTIVVLLESGVEPAAASPSGKQPIHYAADSRHLAVVALLLEHGIDVNTPTSTGWTPLHIATANGDRALVEFLMQRGADIRRPTGQGMTAEQIARARGHREVAMLLASSEATAP